MEEQKPKKRRWRRIQTKEQMDKKIQKVYDELVSHVGEPAILIEKDGRKMVPYLVTLESVVGAYTSSAGVKSTQACYSPDGGFRCRVNRTVSVLKLITGEQKIVYLDEGF